MSGLYIHIPFCHSKCAYCDFYSTPKAAEEIDAYIEAVIKEYALRQSEMPDGERFPRTVYIGGGTPSILPAAAMHRLVEGLQEVVGKPFAENVEEFTVEVNPEDVTENIIKEITDLGVNRISMGVQTFDDPTLRLLGRNHNARQAHAALELLSAKGLNYSADLIFGLPGQSLADWERQLSTLLDYQPPHFSAYLLSYEPGTRLYAMMLAGKVTETDEELACEMYAQLIDEAARRGYSHYEISNYAHSIVGAPSIHNSNYWNSTPYLGLGASAHSFDGLTRRFNPSNFRKYISTLSAGLPFFEVDEESETDRLNDCIITALRTSAGLNIKELAKHFSPSLIDRISAALNRHKDRLETLPGNENPIAPNQSNNHSFTPNQSNNHSFTPNQSNNHSIAPNQSNNLSAVRIPESEWLKADNILRSLIID